MSYAEIAEKLERPVGTVKTWVHRAQHKVIERLSRAASWRRCAMNCQSFETRLDELLDRRLSPDVDPQLAEHGQHCRRCNRMLADYLALSAAIDSLTSPGAFTDLPATCWRKLHRTRTSRSLSGLRALLAPFNQANTLNRIGFRWRLGLQWRSLLRSWLRSAPGAG